MLHNPLIPVKLMDYDLDFLGFRTPRPEPGLVIPSNANRDHMESGPIDGVSHRVPRDRRADQVIFQRGVVTISHSW